MLRQHGTATRYTELYFLLLYLVMLFPYLMLFFNVNSELIIDPDGTFCKFYYIVTRNNIVWKLACVWLLFMLLQDFFASARLHRVHNFFFTNECSTLFVTPKIK